MKYILSVWLTLTVLGTRGQEILVPLARETTDSEIDIQLKNNSLTLDKISKIPARVFAAKNLHTLRIFVSDSLKELSPEVRNLVNLHHLSIDHTGLAELPGEIGKLKNLTFLRLA